VFPQTFWHDFRAAPCPGASQDPLARELAASLRLRCRVRHPTHRRRGRRECLVVAVRAVLTESAQHLAMVVSDTPSSGHPSGFAPESAKTPREAAAWLSACREADVPVCPWFHSWLTELNLSLRCQQSEMLDSPAAVVLVVSTSATNPFVCFEALAEMSSLPAPFHSGMFDPSIPKVMVLLHDVCGTPPDGVDPVAMAEGLRARFPGAMSFFLPINSLPAASPNLEQPDLWAKSMRGLTLSLAPTSIDPSAPETATDASRDFLPCGAGQLPGSGELHTALLKLAVGGVRGSLLSPEDIASIRKVCISIVERAVVPSLENRLTQLQEHVTATKRGIRNALKSFLRGKKDLPSSPLAASASWTTPVLYPHSSTESQVRALADLLFQLGDFSEASTLYKLCKDDFKADNALFHYASAVEMIGRCMVLSGAVTLDAAAHFERAAGLYYEAAKAALNPPPVSSSGDAGLLVYSPGFSTPPSRSAIRLRTAAASFSAASAAKIDGASTSVPAAPSRRDLSSLMSDAPSTPVSGAARARMSPSLGPVKADLALDEFPSACSPEVRSMRGPPTPDNARRLAYRWAVRLATRAAVQAAAVMIASGENRESEASALLRRTALAEGEGTLACALLMEQAALACLHHARPQLRRGALHFVLAGESYSDCTLPRLAVRAYSVAVASYRAGRGWDVSEDHIRGRLALMLERQGHPGMAVGFLALLLREGAGRIPLESQAGALVQLGRAFQAWSKKPVTSRRGSLVTDDLRGLSPGESFSDEGHSDGEGGELPTPAPGWSGPRLEDGGIPVIEMDRTRVSWFPSSEASRLVSRAIARVAGTYVRSDGSAEVDSPSGFECHPLTDGTDAPSWASERVPVCSEEIGALDGLSTRSVRISDFSRAPMTRGLSQRFLFSAMDKAAGRLSRAVTPHDLQLADASSLEFGHPWNVTDEAIGATLSPHVGLGEGPFAGGGAPEGNMHAPALADCVWESMRGTLERELDRRFEEKFALDTDGPLSPRAVLPGDSAKQPLLNWRQVCAEVACIRVDSEEAEDQGKPGRALLAMEARRKAMGVVQSVRRGVAVAVCVRLKNPLKIPLVIRGLHLRGTVVPSSEAAPAEEVSGHGWLDPSEPFLDCVAGPSLRALPITLVIPPQSSVSAPLLAFPTADGNLSVEAVEYSLGNTSNLDITRCTSRLVLVGLPGKDEGRGKKPADRRLEAVVATTTPDVDLTVEGVPSGSSVMEGQMFVCTLRATNSGSVPLKRVTIAVPAAGAGVDGPVGPIRVAQALDSAHGHDDSVVRSLHASARQAEAGAAPVATWIVPVSHDSRLFGTSGGLFDLPLGPDSLLPKDTVVCKLLVRVGTLPRETERTALAPIRIIARWETEGKVGFARWAAKLQVARGPRVDAASHVDSLRPGLVRVIETCYHLPGDVPRVDGVAVLSDSWKGEMGAQGGLHMVALPASSRERELSVSVWKAGTDKWSLAEYCADLDPIDQFCAGATALGQEVFASWSVLEALDIPSEPILDSVRQQSAATAFAAECVSAYTKDKALRRAVDAAEQLPRSLREIRVENQRRAAEGKAAEWEASRPLDRLWEAEIAAIDDTEALKSEVSGAMARDRWGGSLQLNPGCMPCSMGALCTGRNSATMLVAWMSGEGAGMSVVPVLSLTPHVHGGKAVSAEHTRAGFPVPPANDSLRVVLAVQLLSGSRSKLGEPVRLRVKADCVGQPVGTRIDSLRVRVGMSRGTASAAGARMLDRQVLSLRGFTPGSSSSGDVSVVFGRPGVWDLSSVFTARSEVWPPKDGEQLLVPVGFAGRTLVIVDSS
jgi:hypothetical protein